MTKLTLECTRSGGAGLGSYIKHAVGLEEINVIMENLTPQTAAELLDGCCSSKSMRRLRVFDKGIDSHVAAKLSRYRYSNRTTAYMMTVCMYLFLSNHGIIHWKSLDISTWAR